MVLVAVCCTVIAGIFAVAKSKFWKTDPATTSGAVPADGGTANDEASSFSDMTEWESTQTEINAFETELGPSEADAAKLWRMNSEAKPP